MSTFSTLRSPILATLWLALIPLVIGCDESTEKTTTTQKTETNIVIQDATVRPPLGKSRTGAGYLTIINNSESDARLLSVESAHAEHVELHTITRKDNNVIQMRKIDFIDIPAGKQANLEPGGDHLMLFDMTMSTKLPDSFPLVFTFEDGTRISVEAQLAPISHDNKTGNQHH